MPVAPLVSVVTPAFNAADHVAETVRSVQAQTFENWEMLVADDCSSDSTADLVQQLGREDPRVRLVKLEQNRGPAGARNAALAASSGRYLAFLDSDDLWLPEKLDRQLAFMAKHDCALTYTAFRRISSDGRRVGRLMPVPARMTYDDLLKNTAIATLTVMLDREKTGDPVMTDVGYDDFTLWLEILRGGEVAHGLQEDLARYRVVRGSVSSRPMRSADWVWRVYRDIEKMSVIASAYCLCHYGARAFLKRLRF